MKGPLVIAVVLVLLAPSLRADDLSGRVLLSFQHYDFDELMTSGLRQTYDLQWQRAFTTTTLFRLSLRADDFRGSTETPLFAERNRTTQVQPVGEIIINTDALHLQARSEILQTDATRGGLESTTSLRRSWGSLEWRPADLPTFDLRGQRNESRQTGESVAVTDDFAAAGVRYQWRGLQARAEQRYLGSYDPGLGYDRKTTGQLGELNYALTTLGGRFTVGTSGSAQRTQIVERSLDGQGTSVPVPLVLSRAYWGVDDTPNDSRDHPLASYPTLTDGNVDTSAGIALGPDAVSFQNLAFDLGRDDLADEIRVVVRDAAGNPIRNGGGPVTWDLYSSEDGQLWTARTSQTTWNAARSYYAITFDVTTARWFKVVNFGVNVEATFVTELQAYVHREIGAGESRTGTQNQYSLSTILAARLTKRIRLTYTGAYSSFEESLETAAPRSTSNREHIGEIEYQALRSLAIRGRVVSRNSSTFEAIDDSANSVTAYADWIPTRDLRVSLELSRESQTIGATEFELDTRALHASATVIPSVLVSLDAGVQTQTISATGESSTRRFASLNGSLQLLRSLRLAILASTQQTDSVLTDPAVPLLGPQRDDRYSGELTWRPGRPLTLRSRIGWYSGAAISGFTQQYRAEWYPFEDGTLSIGGTYDQDIDPLLGRRASRLILNPRWTMNRYATFDIQYTAVSNAYGLISSRQRTLFATLTLTR